MEYETVPVISNRFAYAASHLMERRNWCLGIFRLTMTVLAEVMDLFRKDTSAPSKFLSGMMQILYKEQIQLSAMISVYAAYHHMDKWNWKWEMFRWQ